MPWSKMPAMSEPRVDHQTGKTFGDLVPPRSHETSVIERTVRDFLITAGYPVAKKSVGILCHHPDEYAFLTLTPDIVLEDWRLVVEVDPCAPVDGMRGATHRGKEEVDRLRNTLLADVGWTTLRLRIGATLGEEIGDRDVLVESSSFTRSAQTALIEALDDFKADRPPRVRVAKKSASPRRSAQRKSQLVNIGEHRYSDGGFIFSWFPSLESKDKIVFRLPMGGRFLYTHDTHSRVPLFVAEVGLHEVAREEWKPRLTDYLLAHADSIAGTTKWPWGKSILTGDGSAAAREISTACEHEKHTIDRMNFWFTVSGHLAQRSSPTALYATEDTEAPPLVALHPEAVEIGYRFAGVTSEKGYRGPYQRLYISRDPAVAAQVDG